MSRNKRLIYLINIGLVLILFAILTILEASGVFTRYTMSILRLVCINVVLATSLNVTVGKLRPDYFGPCGIYVDRSLYGRFVCQRS